MADYLANVRAYDAGADEAVVAKIVKGLGIALRNRDSSLVSGTDPKELQRVVDGFCKKKLGLEKPEAEKAVQAVVEIMKGDRAKCRVAFYYLTAKQVGKLDNFK